MRGLVIGCFIAAAVVLPVGGAVAQSQEGVAGEPRDSIAEIIRRDRGAQRLAQGAPLPPGKAQAPTAPPAQAPAQPQAQPPGQTQVQPPSKDPREGDAAYEQAQRLMKAIDSVLNDTARHRGEARKLPSTNDFLVRPLWTETREDRERKIRDLLDSALGIVTDVPVVESQKKIEALRGNIRDIEDRIVKLREKQLTAPKDALIPGITADTVDSLERDIADSKARIDLNKDRIAAAKEEIRDGLAKSGIQLAPDQLDLLLDGVLSGDLVRLVAVFNSAKLIDGQLGKLMAASGENIGAARKYFAMHAALFAILVHAQDSMIAKIDKQYLPKLDAIMADVATARGKTAQLLRAENRPDQRRALEANRDSQRLAEEAAKGYRRYLLQQREQIARARARAIHDLRIADNTFETVEASFQLRVLMRESATSFEAIQKLEAPTFEQIFRNEELRREFESLTRKLDAPSS
jgi:alpha-D-ribose 1-methylphosphonate 5-triphosphate diphosphatase PhnM